MKKLQNSSGFTLIELMVVIVIIGILAGIALPLFKGDLSRYQLGTNAKTVSAIVRLAQTKALSEGKSYIVDFTSSPLRIRTYAEGVDPDTQVSLVEIKELRGVNLVSADNIKYGINGLPTQSGSIELSLTSNSSDSITVTVNSIGRVSIQ